MVSMFTVCSMLLRIYKELTKNLAYRRLNCISGLRINLSYISHNISDFFIYYFFIFFHRCQRLFLTRILRLTAFAGQPLAGQPGVEQRTVPLKEQEDGAWKDFILMSGFLYP